MKKYIFILLTLALSLSAGAQVIVPLSGTPMIKKFTNAGVPFYVTYDTVTNTGVNFLTNRYITSGQAQTVTIQWNAVKTSGTVAGTVTLMGSLDGLNFKAITGNKLIGNEAMATFTATDVATQTTSWVLQGNPFPWYRVSWTGTGTMVATQSVVYNAH